MSDWDRTRDAYMNAKAAVFAYDRHVGSGGTVLQTDPVVAAALLQIDVAEAAIAKIADVIERGAYNQ